MSVPGPGDTGERVGEKTQGDEAAKLDILGLRGNNHPSSGLPEMR